MLVDMRIQFSGGMPFIRSLQDLLESAPSGPAFHNMDQYDFRRLASEMSMDMARTCCNKSSWGVATTELFNDIEKALTEQFAPLPKSAKAAFAISVPVQVACEDDSGEILADTGTLKEVAFQEPNHLLFVNLPLGVYVRNSPHLYEMLSRLRQLRNQDSLESVEQITYILDKDGHRYSVLVYAIIAALQILYKVAHARTAAAWKLRGLWPLNGSTLDSSPLRWTSVLENGCVGALVCVLYGVLCFVPKGAIPGLAFSASR